jgi:type II secretory ATPase GspE/PulE/Tfp pilus assembly ATPase PilB-like protein
MTGYKGRVLISEYYIPDIQTVELIKREATVGEFEAQFAQIGNVTLQQDGMSKAASGITTEQEVRSVVG